MADAAPGTVLTLQAIDADMTAARIAIEIERPLGPRANALFLFDAVTNWLAVNRQRDIEMNERSREGCVIRLCVCRCIKKAAAHCVMRGDPLSRRSSWFPSGLWAVDKPDVLFVRQRLSDP